MNHQLGKSRWIESALTTIVVLVCTLALQFPAGAQTQAETVGIRSGPVYVTTADWPEARIVIEPQPGPGIEQTEIILSAADLVLLEEDKQTVSASGLEHFEDTEEGIAIVLAIDVSGSMKGEPLNAVKQGLVEFVRRAREYDAVSIATFADDVHWETSWDASQSEIQRAIENLQVRGTRTILYDALQSAVEKFADSSTGEPLPIRSRVIVISDGLDEGSRSTLDQVIAKAMSSRVQVDSIGITARSRQYVTSLQRVSDESGGVFRAAPDLPQLKDQISRGIDRLLKTPVATFRIDELKPDGKLHTIGVKWKKMNTSDTLPVTLPKAAWWSLEGRLRAWQAAGLSGMVFVGGLLLFMRMRARPAAPTPPPAAQAPPVSARVATGATPHTPTQAVRSRTEAEPGAIPQRKPTVMETVPAAAAAVRSTVPDTPSTAGKGETRRTQLAPVIPQPASGRPAIVFRATDGPLRGRTFSMESVEFWIGAAESNHIRVGDDNFMSGKHCCVRFEQQVLRLYDNASTNKTYLNGEALGESARMIKVGDRIQAGQSTFIVEAPTA